MYPSPKSQGIRCEVWFGCVRPMFIMRWIFPPIRTTAWLCKCRFCQLPYFTQALLTSRQIPEAIFSTIRQSVQCFNGFCCWLNDRFWKAFRLSPHGSDCVRLSCRRSPKLPSRIWTAWSMPLGVKRWPSNATAPICSESPSLLLVLFPWILRSVGLKQRGLNRIRTSEPRCALN